MIVYLAIMRPIVTKLNIVALGIRLILYLMWSPVIVEFIVYYDFIVSIFLFILLQGHNFNIFGILIVNRNSRPLAGITVTQ